MKHLFGNAALLLALGLVCLGCRKVVPDSAKKSMLGLWCELTLDRGQGAVEAGPLSMEFTDSKVMQHGPTTSMLVGTVVRINCEGIPHQIDVEKNGEIRRGIFLIEDGKMKLMFAGPGKARPRGFAGSAEAPVLTLRKVSTAPPLDTLEPVVLRIVERAAAHDTEYFEGLLHAEDKGRSGCLVERIEGSDMVETYRGRYSEYFTRESDCAVLSYDTTAEGCFRDSGFRVHLDWCEGRWRIREIVLTDPRPE